MNAILDVPLSKHLASGRLFVGQKLRVMCWSLLFILPSLIMEQMILNSLYALRRSGEQDYVAGMGQFHHLRFSMA